MVLEVGLTVGYFCFKNVFKFSKCIICLHYRTQKGTDNILLSEKTMCKEMKFLHLAEVVLLQNQEQQRHDKTSRNQPKNIEFAYR